MDDAEAAVDEAVEILRTLQAFIRYKPMDEFIEKHAQPTTEDEPQ